MKAEDYAYMYDLEKHFWWFVGMREISAVLLDRVVGQTTALRVLDAGCGTGANLEWLARYAGEGKIIGIDFVSTALTFCRERQLDGLIQASATDLPFADATFDLVTSFDVLVQIAGERADDRAIREMHRVLKPGGIAFVRGAAYGWMRSGHDEALSTQRRYNLGELREKIERAGFTVIRATYANTLVFPAAAVRRLVLKRIGLADSGSDVKPFPPRLQWLNRLLTSALQMEARYLKDPQAKLAAGLSAICIARKPER